MYLYCDGVFTTDNQGDIQCSGTISSVPDSSIETVFEALSIPDALAISSAIFLVWAVAYGIKYLLNFLNSSATSRYH